MLLRLLLTVSAVVTTVVAQTSTTHTYSANGRTLTYTLTILEPPIAIQLEASRFNQDSAVDCTILFMWRVSKGDIAGAAALTNVPDTTAKLYTDARARMGANEFAKQMSNVFNGDRYRYELSKATSIF